MPQGVYREAALTEAAGDFNRDQPNLRLKIHMTGNNAAEGEGNL